jgi:hypothetical protein
MGKIKRLPLWKQKHTISPVVATLLGFAFGCILAILCALNPPDHFSFRFLSTMLLILVPFGSIGAYVLWLVGDPVRGDHFLRTMRLTAFLMISGLLVAIPITGWRNGLSIIPILVVLMMAVLLMVMLIVAIGWGIFHFFKQIVSSYRQYSKPVASFQRNGVWDRELDQG